MSLELPQGGEEQLVDLARAQGVPCVSSLGLRPIRLARLHYALAAGFHVRLTADVARRALRRGHRLTPDTAIVARPLSSDDAMTNLGALASLPHHPVDNVPAPQMIDQSVWETDRRLTQGGVLRDADVGGRRPVRARWMKRPRPDATGADGAPPSIGLPGQRC